MNLRREVLAWHVTTGTLTRDEARARVFDLAPLPDGAGATPIVINSGGAVTEAAPP